MALLQRVPPAVGQGLVIAGLAAGFLGVALPHLRAASGEGARVELSESEAYLAARVDEFARVNELSINHSLEVTNFREQLSEDLDIPDLRRAAAAHAGSDKRTPTGPLVVFAGLVLLGLGCLTMVVSGSSGHAIWAAFLILALCAGGVGLSHPEAQAVPAMKFGVDEPLPDAPKAEVSINGRRLCEHLMKIVFSGQGNAQPTEAMLASCMKTVAEKPPTAEQQRCIMRARTADDLQACNLK